MRVKILGFLVLLTLLVPALVAQQQEVRVQSGPSNSVTFAAPVLKWDCAETTLEVCQSHRWDLEVNGTWQDLVGVVCGPPTGQTPPTMFSCELPMPAGVPVNAAIRVRAFVVVPSPPPPASVRIVVSGGSGG